MEQFLKKYVPDNRSFFPFLRDIAPDSDAPASDSGMGFPALRDTRKCLFQRAYHWDFTRFVVNSVVSLSEWNPTFVNYYPWLVLGKIKIPPLYISHFLVAVISWQLFWVY